MVIDAPVKKLYLALQAEYLAWVRSLGVLEKAKLDGKVIPLITQVDQHSVTRLPLCHVRPFISPKALVRSPSKAANSNVSPAGR